MSTVDDRIIWAKELKQDSDAIAEAITEHLKASDKEEYTGFCLFMVDMRTGTVQYVSDLPHTDAVGMLAHWVNANKQ